MLLITRRYTWESAHFLPLVADTHKCKRLHGHHYACEITLTGPIDERGWLLDFWDLDAIILPIVERIDHRLLNDIAGLENPTAEEIATWFYEKAVGGLSTLPAERRLYAITEVKIYETPEAIAIYRPDKMRR